MNWVIQGGQSGKGAVPFEISWARQMLSDCHAAGVPYFLKQLGRAVLLSGQELKLKDPHGGDWSMWPEDIRIRQMPTVPVQIADQVADV